MDRLPAADGMPASTDGSREQAKNALVYKSFHLHYAELPGGKVAESRKIMHEQLAAILTELRRGFEALYGERLGQILLFGSQARGDARPESDIDVLVVLQGPVDPGEEIARTGEVTALLSLKHDVVISRVFISAEQFYEEQSPLLLNVRREGVQV